MPREPEGLDGALHLLGHLRIARDVAIADEGRIAKIRRLRRVSATRSATRAKSRIVGQCVMAGQAFHAGDYTLLRMRVLLAMGGCPGGTLLLHSAAILKPSQNALDGSFADISLQIAIIQYDVLGSTGGEGGNPVFAGLLLILILAPIIILPSGVIADVVSRRRRRKAMRMCDWLEQEEG